MNETPASAKSAVSSLETLNIRDCSFSFRAFFEHPHSLEAISVDQLANTLLERFREQNLSVAEITLEKGDSLFGYSLNWQN